MFWNLNHRIGRIRDGICYPMPPSEILAWCELSGTIVDHIEYAIICAMDDAFCSETNKQLNDYRTRQQEQQRADLEAARAKRRK